MTDEQLKAATEAANALAFAIEKLHEAGLAFTADKIDGHSIVIDKIRLKEFERRFMVDPIVNPAPYKPGFCMLHNQEQPCSVCEKNEDEEDKRDASAQLPPREAFNRMKQHLRNWIEKNNVRTIQTCFDTEPDGKKGVRFIDTNNRGDDHLVIIDWPRIGLIDGAEYTAEELLETGGAGE